MELWQQDGLADSGHALVHVGQNKNQKRPRYGYNTGPVEPFTLKHLDVDPCCWTDEGPAYCCITSPRPRDIWTLDEAPVCAGLDGFGRSCLKPWFHYLFNCIYLLVWRFQIWKHFSFAPEPKWHRQNETEGNLLISTLAWYSLAPEQIINRSSRLLPPPVPPPPPPPPHSHRNIFDCQLACDAVSSVFIPH